MRTTQVVRTTSPKIILDGGSSDRSAARVLILTTFDLDEYVFTALRAGASGGLVRASER